jgi:hypothetical protein
MPTAAISKMPVNTTKHLEPCSKTHRKSPCAHRVSSEENKGEKNGINKGRTCWQKEPGTPPRDVASKMHVNSQVRQQKKHTENHTMYKQKPDEKTKARKIIKIK